MLLPIYFLSTNFSIALSVLSDKALSSRNIIYCSFSHTKGLSPWHSWQFSSEINSSILVLLIHIDRIVVDASVCASGALFERF